MSKEVLDNIRSGLDYVAIGISGSRAYNTHSSNSDIDIMAVYMPKLEELFPIINGDIHGLISDSSNRTISNKDYSTDKFDVKEVPLTNFFNLLMKGSFNTIELLFLKNDDLIVNTKTFQFLIDNRDLFLTQETFKSILGAVNNQFNRALNKNNRNYKDYKMMSHCYRLARTALNIANHNTIILTDGCEITKQIKQSKYSWESCVDIVKNELMDIEDIDIRRLPTSKDIDPREFFSELIKIHFNGFDYRYIFNRCIDEYFNNNG